MEPLNAPAGFIDDLLDFDSDIDEEDDDESTKSQTLAALSLPAKSSGIVEEEELEWISNKDAFPMVETFVDIFPNHHPPFINNHQSPVSVLENSTGSFTSTTSNKASGGGSSSTTTATAAFVTLCSNLKIPVKARSKRRKRRRELFSGPQWQCWPKETQKPAKPRAQKPKLSPTLGRKCLHCQTEKTPQWRAGPNGPKTLCNACGVRYKSGRLVPEYRPASSPTFSSELHSNSHRKIVEMRKQKSVRDTRPLAI